MKNKILIIIPAYNEEKTIKDVYFETKKVLKEADVLIINDCSTDGTRKILEESNMDNVSLSINLGIGGAMQTGYIYALQNDYDFAVQVDGDGQHKPSEISKLVQAQQRTSANLVIGSRFLGEKSYRSTRVRRIGIKVFSLVTKILVGEKICDPTSGFRLADRKVINLFANYYPSDYPEPEVIIWLKKNGVKIVETSVQMSARRSGKSSITALKSIYYMVKVVGSMLVQKLRG